jgi:2-keto-4-pentenoate hydratase
MVTQRTKAMTAETAAAALHVARKAHSVLGDPPGGVADLAEAYRIQEAFVALMEADDGPTVGWKVALTSPVMQQMCGVDHPCEGAVLRDRVHASPATCDTSKLGRLGVEAEIALTIGKDMTGDAGPYTAESAAACVASARAAIELVDDQNADYAAITAIRLVANNSLNHGIVVGPEVADWRSLDLASLKGAMLIEGVVVAEGTGADILGHPLNAVIWLSNSLNARGKMLRKGDVVMCGSFVRTQFPTAGQTVTCRVEGLGEASVKVE